MQTVQPVRPAVDIHCCRSIDEQARLLESWNQTYCQISRGAFDGSVSSVRAGAVRILVERMNRTVYQRGCVDGSRIAVGIPFQLEGHALLCGQVSHLDGLHVFRARRVRVFIARQTCGRESGDSTAGTVRPAASPGDG